MHLTSGAVIRARMSKVVWLQIAIVLVACSSLSNAFTVNVGIKSAPPLRTSARILSTPLLSTSMKIPGLETLVQLLSPKPAVMSKVPVIAAVQDRNEQRLDALIRENADVNGVDPSIGNAMHWIALNGHYQYPPTGIPKKLVDAGLDLNAKSPEGSTALEISLLKGWQKIAMLLLDRGADRSVVTDAVKSKITCPDCKKVVRDYKL